MSKYREFLSQLTLGLVLRILSIIIVASATGIAVWLVTKVTSEIPLLQQYSTWIYALLVLLTIFIIIRVWIRYQNLKPLFPDFETNFHQKEVEITHEYTSTNQVIHKRKFLLEAKKNGINSFNDKFIWTGDAYDLSCITPRCQLVNTGKSGYFDTYRVLLDRSLKKGDIIELTMKWDCTNTGNNAVPFFSRTIERPTEKLTMKLKLATTLNVSEAIQVSTFNQNVAPEIYESKPLDNGELTWSIDNPKLHYQYEVRWNF